jgi:hypothetical protein
MATVSPYHTNSTEHRNVRHDDDNCPDGKGIMPDIA